MSYMVLAKFYIKMFFLGYFFSLNITNLFLVHTLTNDMALLWLVLSIVVVNGVWDAVTVVLTMDVPTPRWKNVIRYKYTRPHDCSKYDNWNG